jgi:signal transduction histidine kinase
MQEPTSRWPDSPARWAAWAITGVATSITTTLVAVNGIAYVGYLPVPIVLAGILLGPVPGLILAALTFGFLIVLELMPTYGVLWFIDGDWLQNPLFPYLAGYILCFGLFSWYLGWATDRVVSRLKQDHRRLASAHDAMIQAMPDLLIRCDVDGCIREIVGNLAAVPFSGHTMQVGRPLAEAVPHEVRDDVLAAWQRTRQNRELQIVRFAWQTFDRQAHFAEMRLVPAGDDRVFVIVRDDTPRRQLEDTLRAQRDAAEETARAKSEFLAVMSHELRTPLNGVVGMSDLLATTTLSVEQADYVEGLQECAGTLASFINDVLDLSKLEAGRVDLRQDPFDLDELLATTATTVQSRAETKGLSLPVEYPAVGAVRLLGDPLCLRQILLNLLSNAIKVTDHGAVRFGASIGTPGPGGCPVAFHVSDSGPGIPAARMTQIFEAFRQLPPHAAPDEPGTGLGLTIASRLTALMGAAMHVESTLGEGACFSFTVTLPTADGEGPTDTARPLAGQSWWIGGDTRQLDAIGRLVADRWGASLMVSPAVLHPEMGDGSGTIWLSPEAPATDLQPGQAIVLAPLRQLPRLRQALPGNTILPLPVRPVSLLQTLQLRTRSQQAIPTVHVALIDENPVSQRITGSMLERLQCTLAGADAGAWGERPEVVIWSCDPEDPAAGPADEATRQWLLRHPDVPLLLLVPAHRQAMATPAQRVLSRPVTLRQLGDAIAAMTARQATTAAD